MKEQQKRRILIVVICIIIAGGTLAGILSSREKETIQLSQLAGLWQVYGIFIDDSLVSDSATATMIAIDENGGYRFWEDGVDETGFLVEKEGKLYFESKNGTQCLLYKRDDQLVIEAKQGENEATWICQWVRDYGDTQMSDAQLTEQYCLIQKEATKIEDSTTRFLYTSIRTRMLQGTGFEEAASDAKDAFLLNCAYQWYAAENNISVSDEELEEYLDEIVKSAMEAEDFDEISAACEKAGMSYVDFVEASKESYYIGMLTEKLNEENSEGWDAFTASVQKAYKKTEQYDDDVNAASSAIADLKTELGNE